MKPLRIFTSILLAGVCAALASTVHAAPKVKAKAPPQGKPYLIHAGWVGPSLEFLKEHVEEVEAQAPFDGYLFGMDVTCPMYNQKIEINEQIKNKIKLYKQIKFKRATHNFLSIMIDQAKPDWFDEWRGYCMADENGYKPMAEDNRKGYGQLDSKLVQKHRKVGGVAPAFYLDFYADPKSTLYEWQPRKNYEGNPARLLKRQLREAKRNATGGHIWIYGEKGQFWDWTKFKKGKATMANRFPMWEEKIPGIRKAIFGNEYQDPDVDHKGRVLPDMSYYISDTMFGLYPFFERWISPNT